MTSDDSGIFEVPPLPADAPPAPVARRDVPAAPPTPRIPGSTAPPSSSALPLSAPSADAGASAPPPTAAPHFTAQPAPANPNPRPPVDDEFTLPAIEEKAVRLTGVLWSPPAPPKPPARPTSAAARADNPPPRATGAAEGAPPASVSMRELSISPPPSNAIRVRIDGSVTRKPGRSITLSARKLDFPAACACCGAAPNAVYDAVLRRTRGKRREDRVWTVPYCSNCIAHMNRAARLAHGAIALGCVSGAAILAIWWVMGAPLIGLLVGVIAGIGAWGVALSQQTGAIRRSLPPQCAAAAPAVRYEKFRGSHHRIYFANSAYADEFERMNAKKIVAPSDLESQK